jgi:predicted permease
MQDVRFAMRMLLKDRWFTLASVVALTLGIGVTTAVFTFVNAALLRALPVTDPDRVVHLGTGDSAGRELGVSYLDFRDWRDGAASFAGMAASVDTAMIVGDDTHAPERFQGTYISANAFQLIGQAPLLGRDFRSEDEESGASPVVMIGSGVWKTRFGGDPALVGRTIRVNEVPSVVIGIMPDGFRFPNVTDGWQPLTRLPGLTVQKRDVRTLNVFARLRDGTTVSTARTELNTIAARLNRDHPDTNKDVRPTVVTLREYLQGGSFRTMFLTLMGAVTFVLLIACTNIANLLLARAANRSREIAIRTSLGATRWRIVRQLLIECALLTIIAGALGFAFSVYAVRVFAAAVEQGTLNQQPYWLHWTIDSRVFAFLIMTCFATTLLSGLVPALLISKTNMHDTLKEGGRTGTSGGRARRWTSALIVIELASTVVLLAGAGLMTRSFLALYRAANVISTSDLVTMRLTMPIQKYQTADQRKDFVERLENTVRSIPGVVSATVANWAPFGGSDDRQLDMFGRPNPPGEKPATVSYIYVGPQYFDTLGVAIIQGRMFTDVDGRPGHESAIVNQRFVSTFFPGENPIGQRIRLTTRNAGTFAPTPNGRVDTAAGWVTIVGVSPTVPQKSPQDPDPVVYVPYRGEPQPVRSAALIVRGRQGIGSIVPALREEIRRFEPELPLYFVLRMDDWLAVSRWPQRVFGGMFVMLGFIALIIASVGLYAVTAYGITQRIGEIGIRMALGAQVLDVVWLFVRRTVVHLAVGVAIGLGGAVLVGRLLQSFLVGTTASDPMTLGGVTALLVLVAMTACLLPSSRAGRVDPVVALRDQ